MEIVACTVSDASQVGAVRRLATQIAASMDFNDAEQGRVALVATELASNLVRHAMGWQVLICSLATGSLDLLSLDKGPGMTNVTQCLADGYSTAKGLGAGLGTITRLAALWDIDSRPGVGTAVWLRMTSRQTSPAPAAFDIGAICLPLSGETASGDDWGVRFTSDGVQLVVADGLGHGPLAAKASQQATRLLQSPAIATPQALLSAMHAAMRDTRGAAVSVAEINRAQGELRYAGVGNITGVLLTPQRAQHLFCHSGIVFRFVNKRYANWFERPADDIVGRELRQLVEVATLSYLQPHIDRVLSGHTVAFEHQEPSSERDQQWSYVNLIPDFGEQEQVRGFFVLSQDITELKRAEVQLREQCAMMVQNEKLATMGMLLASVAHELNNPLGTLMLQVDMLREDAATAELAGQLDEIQQMAERCMYTVQSFLALSRQNVHQRISMPLNPVVEEALGLVMHTLEMDNIRVQRDFSDGLPSVHINTHQFQQVVLALLINAQQALGDIPSKREICLTTRFDAKRDRVVLEIADTGPGVPEENQTKIFEPFYTTKPEGVGTGLGLSICQGIIVGHGGTLELVTSTAQGAVFRIALPSGTAIESTDIPNANDEEPPSVPLSTKTILLVDDNEGNAKAFARLLGRDGYAVDVGGDGYEALEALHKRDYDLIICDVHMPRLEGPALYERLSATHPHLLSRFLFITGDAISTEIIDFFQRAGVPYLTKPFGAAKARRAVQQALAAR